MLYSLSNKLLPLVFWDFLALIHHLPLLEDALAGITIPSVVHQQPTEQNFVHLVMAPACVTHSVTGLMTVVPISTVLQVLAISTSYYD